MKKSRAIKAKTNNTGNQVNTTATNQASTTAPKVEEKVAAPAAAEEVKETVTVTAKAEEVQTSTDVYLQFANQETKLKDVVARIKALYAEQGNDPASLKTLQVYVKPEESAAYYVTNGVAAGKVDLF